jgi:type IX secretion system PorP/SprF family membrane protein
MTTNPALTGIFRGDIRVYGVVRSQWDEASTSYRTVHLAADGKIFNPKNTKGFFSVGGQIFRDEAGDSDLGMTSLAANGSYTRALDRENFVSFGLNVAIAQRKFNVDNLTWNNQYSGDSHNPNLNSKENFDNSSRIFPDFGAGINWHGKKMKSRSTMDVGAAFFHLASPRQNFYDGDEAKLPMRISLYILPTVQISDKADLVFNANAQLQDTYTELLGGGAFRYYLNTRKTQEVALQLGGAFRFNKTGDAFVVGAEFHYHYMIVGFTYDVNVSKFQEATNRNGGPELTVRYTIHKVRPLKYRKLCPLL